MEGEYLLVNVLLHRTNDFANEGALQAKHKKVSIKLCILTFKCNGFYKSISLQNTNSSIPQKPDLKKQNILNIMEHRCKW